MASIFTVTPVRIHLRIVLSKKTLMIFTIGFPLFLNIPGPASTISDCVGFSYFFLTDACLVHVLQFFVAVEFGVGFKNLMIQTEMIIEG